MGNSYLYVSKVLRLERATAKIILKGLKAYKRDEEYEI
jgi:hypothetical protein|tara:strand:- start:697 stop:810 length:114 start_codon:yes stop_codon:yes gene_type:complete